MLLSGIVSHTPVPLKNTNQQFISFYVNKKQKQEITDIKKGVLIIRGGITSFPQ